MKPNAFAITLVVVLLFGGVVFFLRARNPEGFNKLVGDATSLFSSTPPADIVVNSGPAATPKKAPAPATTTAQSTATAPLSLPAKIAHPATAAIDKANQEANAVINATSQTTPAATSPANAIAPYPAPAPATSSPSPSPSPAPEASTSVGGIASQAGSDTVNVSTPATAPASNPGASPLVSNSDGASAAGPVGTPDTSTSSAPEWKPPDKIPAQPNWTWTTTDGHTYNNVKVLKMKPDHVEILHSEGGAQVMLSTLPPDLQKLFNYDAQVAAQWAIPSLLEGNLVALKDKTLQPVSDGVLPSIKYYAIFYGASWCPPCQEFTPRLVKFYEKFKADHPNFEVIFISEDKDEDAMLKHMQAATMSWPAFQFDQLVHPPGQFKGPGIEAFANKEIPDLVLVDSTGQILADSYHGSDYVGPDAVLAQIPTLVR